MTTATSSTPEERIDWLRQYEVQSKKKNIRVEKVFSYIYFKLAYDFAFSDGKFIDVTDPVAIDYFLGIYEYEQVRRDFHRNAIVLQVDTDRLYFGSQHISEKRMRRRNSDQNKKVYTFDKFMEIMEDRVFKKKLVNLDDEKETLGVVLRIINQGVSAVPMRIFNAWLRVNSGKFDVRDFADEFGATWLMRPDADDAKGSTQIDIIVGKDKIQLSRREYITAQEFDHESLMDPDEGKAEKWSLLTLISRAGPPGCSNWHLHFSISKVVLQKHARSVTMPLIVTDKKLTNQKPRTVRSGIWRKLTSHRSNSKATDDRMSDMFLSSLTDVCPLKIPIQKKYNSGPSLPYRPEKVGESDRSRKNLSKLCTLKPVTSSTLIRLPDVSRETSPTLRSASRSKDNLDLGHNLSCKSGGRRSNSLPIEIHVNSDHKILSGSSNDDADILWTFTNDVSPREQPGGQYHLAQANTQTEILL